MKLFVKIFILVIIFSPYLCLAQSLDEEGEETKYNKNPHNYKRGFTSQKQKIQRNWYKEKVEENTGVLLPQYEDLASDKSKGITLDDWKSFLLSEKTFKLLDTIPPGGDDILTKEELQQHKLMGKAVKYTQGKELIKKCCSKISGYEENLKELKRRGFSLKPVTYYLDGKAKIEDKCEYPNCNEVWTKKFITIENGKKVKKLKVCLGHYALLLMEQEIEEGVTTSYIFGIILLALVVAVTALLPAFMK